MHRRAVLLLIGMTVVVSAGSVFTRLRASAETLLPITIGYQTNIDWLPLVARDLKLFEKAGLAPAYVKFLAGPPMIAAAQSGSIDLASIGSVPFLIGLSQGVDWVLIGINPEGAYTEGLVARKDSGIDTPADLRGKRIGFFKGSSAHYGLMMTLRQFGFRPDQVTLLHMSPAEQLRALANKEIDAAMVWEPWMQRMVHEAGARIIETEGDIGIYSHVDGYSVRRDWLRDNRETAVRFLRALIMAHDIVRRDTRLAVRVWAKELGIKEAWVEAVYKNAPPSNIEEWTNPRYRYSLVKASPFHRRLGFLATFLFEQQLISDPLDVDDTLDVSVVTDALKAQKDRH
jgi:aliphatic sulfonates family ABC transporter substrate-binding protein